MEAVRITTGSRLHFGLLRLPPQPDWPDDVTRYYGGAGVMIEHPRTVVHIQQSHEFSADGPHAGRARQASMRVAVPDQAVSPVSVVVESAPDAHAGLGSGTQLEMAIACGISRLSGRDDPIETLARGQQRGQRSAIGIHGFAQGGFLIDAGKRRAAEISMLAARHEFPPDWVIVLLTPKIDREWHGEQERAAFAASTAKTDPALPAILETGVVPALIDADFPTFAAAIGEYNARVGDMFRPLQGARYCHPSVENLIAWLTGAGIGGAGQSSWGPTVYGFCDDRARAASAVARVLEIWGDQVTTGVTHARNRGAAIEAARKK